MRARAAVAAGLCLLIAGHVASAQRRANAPLASTVAVEIGGEPFRLEVAIDPQVQYRGLGGRTSIDPHGGMLFAYGRARPMQFVMRDCAIPIDIAFLDGAGRVVAMHEMKPEEPRREGETLAAYESRLKRYRSGIPARFAIELAGGRLAELGVRSGDRIPLDVEPVVRDR